MMQQHHYCGVKLKEDSGSGSARGTTTPRYCQTTRKIELHPVAGHGRISLLRDRTMLFTMKTMRGAETHQPYMRLYTRLLYMDTHFRPTQR